MNSPGKIQQCCLVMYAVLLLGFIVHPSFAAGGMDASQQAADPYAGKMLTAKAISQRLIGTAVGKYPADTFAVIEDVKDGKQWIYREGDVVGDFIIRKILADRVVIDRGRGEEVVKLRRSQVVNTAVPLGLPGSAMQRAIPDLDRKNGPRDRHYLIDANVVAHALADQQKLQHNVEMQQGKLFSRQRGVRIKALTVESALPAMGLRKGDLLLGVNDQPISGPDDAVAMLQTMFDDGREAELKVRRRARTYRIHLQDLQVQ